MWTCLCFAPVVFYHLQFGYLCQTEHECQWENSSHLQKHLPEAELRSSLRKGFTWEGWKQFVARKLCIWGLLAGNRLAGEGATLAAHSCVTPVREFVISPARLRGGGGRAVLGRRAVWRPWVLYCTFQSDFRKIWSLSRREKLHFHPNKAAWPSLLLGSSASWCCTSQACPSSLNLSTVPWECDARRQVKTCECTQMLACGPAVWSLNYRVFLGPLILRFAFAVEKMALRTKSAPGFGNEPCNELRWWLAAGACCWWGGAGSAPCGAKGSVRTARPCAPAPCAAWGCKMLPCLSQLPSSTDLISSHR